MGTAGKNICGLSSAARGAADGAIGAGAAAHGIDAIRKFASGDFWGGMGSLGQSLMLGSQFKACFTGDTPLRMADGTSKRIDEIVVGDVVLSRSEFDPAGEVSGKVVEEVFVRFAQVLHLHVGGQVIGPTHEHPFYCYNEATGLGEWKPANVLSAGDYVLTESGEWKQVEDVQDTGETTTVYNFRVADWHTYFVGDVGWGFAVWAHNAYSPTSGNYAPSAIGRKKHRDFSNLMWKLGHIGAIALNRGKMFIDGAKRNKNGLAGIVYELNPNNPRAIARGRVQAAKYAAQMSAEHGGVWRGVVIVY